MQPKITQPFLNFQPAFLSYDERRNMFKVYMDVEEKARFEWPHFIMTSSKWRPEEEETTGAWMAKYELRDKNDMKIQKSEIEKWLPGKDVLVFQPVLAIFSSDKPDVIFSLAPP